LITASKAFLTRKFATDPSGLVRPQDSFASTFAEIYPTEN